MRGSSALRFLFASQACSPVGSRTASSFSPDRGDDATMGNAVPTTYARREASYAGKLYQQDEDELTLQMQNWLNESLEKAVSRHATISRHWNGE